MDLPKRKKIRLKGYDYSSNGAYFVTICVNGFKQILWQNNNPIVGANFVRPHKQVQLSKIGVVIENEINKLNHIYPNVSVDKYVIMPNHIHMIILILPDDNWRTQFAPTLSRIIKQLKGSITKQLGFSIWQKSFHDHIIRSEKGYRQIWQYIDLNPQTWEDDCFYNKENEENEVNKYGNEKNCELYG